MTKIKNIHFTLLLKIGKQLHEFNFRLRDDVVYDTDTADNRGNRLYFKMKKTEDSWKIQSNAIPAWIAENETVISNALINPAEYKKY